MGEGMAKKNKALNISAGEQRLNLGYSLLRKNALFSKLTGYIHVSGAKDMGKDSAIVCGDGSIYVNRDALLTPEQWAYTIAHCKLHLAFGHFDADRMPGYEKAGEDGACLWVVSCNRMIWNMACDIYISKFLRDIKFGSPTCGNPADFFSGNLADERKIYQYLMEHGNTEDNKSVCGSTASYASFGTAGGMDMRGLEQPRVYDAKRNQKNEFVTNFAYALAYSVSNVVSEAGGHGATDARTQTKSEKAAQWFISHYPLLGGLASGFKVIEDYS